MDPTNRKNRTALRRSCITSILAHLDPRIHLLFEQVQRNRPVAQNNVVKLPDIEPGTELPFGFGSEFLDLELTHFVAERLPGPDDVPVHLDDDVLVGFGGVLAEEIDRLIAGP